MIQKNRPFRVEDLLQPNMPEKFVEVIDGELVMMTPAGWEHNEIAYHFHRLFDQFCEQHPDLHFGFPDDGFLLRRAPDLLLCPDASLFRFRPRTKGSWMEFAPEIAVEVLSPSNTAAEITHKRHQYFAAGTEQVWIARPETQILEFHFREGRCIMVKGNETASGEGLAEGMKIDLQKIFSVRLI